MRIVDSLGDNKIRKKCPKGEIQKEMLELIML